MRRIVTTALMLLFVGYFICDAPCGLERFGGRAMAEEPTGVWRGRWNSQSTGHSGPVRARIVAQPDGSYSARFSGRFAVVIPFTYRADLHPVDLPYGSTWLVSEKKLGPVLGSYRMQAIQTGDQFSADFHAGRDSGRFEMQRVRFSTR